MADRLTEDLRSGWPQDGELPGSDLTAGLERRLVAALDRRTRRRRTLTASAALVLLASTLWLTGPGERAPEAPAFTARPAGAPSTLPVQADLHLPTLPRLPAAPSGRTRITTGVLSKYSLPTLPRSPGRRPVSGFPSKPTRGPANEASS